VRRATLALVAIAALALLPAAGMAGTDTVTRPLRLTVGTLGPIGSLDLRHGTSEVAKEVWNLQYPTLTALDPTTLDPAPGLAAAWTPAPGGKGWIYKLRPGLTWSDGQPLTAADVVYSIDTARDEHWPYATGMVEELRARALNANSVEVTSKHANGPPPGLLLHVVPAHVFSKVGDLDTKVAQLGVADGTWHVVSKTADSVELDTTTAPAGPPLRQIVFRTYPSAGTLIDALAHQQVDVISGVPYSDIGRLEALPNVTVDHAGDGTQYVLFDYLRDERARQAVSLAIDRTDLVAKTVDGVGTPGVVPVVASGASWALDDSTVQSLTQSLDAQPDRARQLFAATPRVTKLTLVAPTDPTSRRVAAYLHRALRAVGVETTAGSTFDPALSLELQRLAITPDPAPLVATLTCDVCTAKFRQYSAATDGTTKVDAAHAMLHAAVAQATVVGLFEPDTLQAFRSYKFVGFLPEPQNPSLVVFGPTVAQYSELSAAPPPPGEGSSNVTYAIGAVIVLALCAGAYAGAVRMRRRFALPEETNAD
jgi:peptide/nickel transport system substrate-binding protein